MSTLTSFFILHSISEWYDLLQNTCKIMFQKYYNAIMLQKRFDWIDIYQDAWKKTIENIKMGKMPFETDSVKNENRTLRFKLYFLVVYRNLLQASYGSLDKGNYTEIGIEKELENLEEEDETDTSPLFAKLWAAFYKLSERCQEMLRAKYLGTAKMTGEDIANEFLLKDAKTAHKRLDECRARLRQIFNEMP